MKVMDIFNVRTTARKLTIALVALMVAISGLVVGMNRSHAAYTPNADGTIGYTITTPDGWWTELGSSGNYQGYHFYCIQIAKSVPEMVTPQSLHTDLEPDPYSQEVAVTKSEMDWLFDKYGRESQRDHLTQAAMSYIIHMNFEEDAPLPNEFGRFYGKREAQQMIEKVVTEGAPVIKVKALQMIAEAQQNALITDNARSGQVSGENTRKGAIFNIGFKDNNGNWVDNVPFTMILNGPAVFDETGTNTWSGVTASAPLSLAWSATANGDVTTIMKFKKSVIVRSVNGGNHQDTLIAPTDKNIEVRGPEFHVIYDFRPMGVSNIAKSDDDGTITDTLDAYADPDYPVAGQGGKWLYYDDKGEVVDEVTDKPLSVVYTATAYYVGTQPRGLSDNIPADAEKVGEKDVTANGPSELKASFKAEKDGFYHVVWTVKADKQPQELQEFIKAGWFDKFGEDLETVVNPYTAQIDSTISTRDTKAGKYFVDDVWVTGMPKDHPDFNGHGRFGADEKIITHKLFFFPEGVEVSEDNLDKAEQIGEEVTIPAKNGFYPSIGDTSWIAKEYVAGTYVFVSEFKGDDRVKPLTTSVTDKNEQVTLKKPKLKTTATDKADGDKKLEPKNPVTITDTVCDENKALIPGKTYTITTDVVRQDNGKSVLDKKVTTTFVPQSADECAVVDITFDGSQLAGQKVVVFESVYDNDLEVAVHNDLTDADQTVEFTDKTIVVTGEATSTGSIALVAVGVLALLGFSAYGIATARARKRKTVV